jgi:myo-inositol-1(or 4)-monophosphatase
MTDDELAFFDAIANAAAQAILPHFRKLDNVSNKLTDGFDPVTVADRNAERAIRDLIIQHFPDDGIVGEEFTAENRRAERTWIIDPIDGTRAFISGLPVWGTLVGRIDGSRAKIGMMAQAFTGEKFMGNGERALFQHGSTIIDLKTRTTADLSDAILFTTTPALFTETELPVYQSIEDTTKLARYGTDCYGYAMVAAGQIDLVIESGLNVYDIAPLIPVIEGAGGIVTDWSGQRCEEGGQILAAANAQLHEQALERLAVAAD